MKRSSNILKWTIDDIIRLKDRDEDDSLEFKSGKTIPKELKHKISAAASAFSNTGGGLFVAGIDEETKEINGIDNAIVGRQSIRDWVDQIICVEPRIDYKIKKIDLNETDKCVLIIQFEKSRSAPHMAYDKKYYIRAGAHTEPASHYLVEAIRLHSCYSKPLIACRLINNTERGKVIELQIFTLNNSAALNVHITFDTFPKWIKNSPIIEWFPLCISVISEQHPFSMDIDFYGSDDECWDEDNVVLKIDYEDLEGNKYPNNRYEINRHKVLSPAKFGDNFDSLRKSINKLADVIREPQR